MFRGKIEFTKYYKIYTNEALKFVDSQNVAPFVRFIF